MISQEIFLSIFYRKICFFQCHVWFLAQKRSCPKGHDQILLLLYLRKQLVCSLACFVFSDRISQFRQDLFYVTYDTQVRYFENRSCVVFVDGDYQFGTFHTSYVLDSTGDTACQCTGQDVLFYLSCLLYTSPSPRD